SGSTRAFGQVTRPASGSIVVGPRKRQFVAHGCGCRFSRESYPGPGRKAFPLARALILSPLPSLLSFFWTRGFFTCFGTREGTEEQCFFFGTSAEAERKVASNTVRVRHRR